MGKASLFAQPGAVLENEGTRAITAIKAIMNNGALDGSIDGIEQVRFINGSYTMGLDPAVVPMVQGSTSSTDEDDGLAGYAIALIVIAAVGALAFAAFLVVERKKKREIKERRKALNNRMVAMHLDELERDIVDIPLD